MVSALARGEVPSASVALNKPRDSKTAGLVDGFPAQTGSASVRGYRLVIKELAGEEGRGIGF